MTIARNFAFALITGVSLLAMTAPAGAGEILFSTATTPSGQPIQRGVIAAVPTEARGGVTQVRTAGDGLASFVGDARFTAGEILEVAEGRMSLRGGSTPVQVRSADGSLLTVAPGGVASLALAPDGTISGRSLAGSLTVTSGRDSTRMRAGDAFAANSASGVSRKTAVAAQPVSAPASAKSADAGAAQGLEAGENPRLARPRPGTTADLLEQALASRNSADGLDFRAVSRAVADVNLAYLRAGGVPGGFTSALAGDLVSDYLTALRTGTGTVPSATTDAYLQFLAIEGTAGLTEAQTTLLSIYQQVLAAGDAPETFTDQAIGVAYSDYIRALAAAGEAGLSASEIAAYEAYARDLGFGDTLDAGRREQIEAYEQLTAAGINPSAIAGADLLAQYVEYLQAGNDAASFEGGSVEGLSALVAYLAVFGLPASVDPAIAETVQGFLAYLADGGSITTAPAPDPIDPVDPTDPEIPPAGRAVWAGSFGGDAYKFNVDFDQNGDPVVLGDYLRPGTARLVESQTGDGWALGRYGDGTIIRNGYGGETIDTYGPNDGLHYGFSTSPTPVSITVGTGTYDVAAFTRPTYADGSLVTEASLTGQLAIDFATLRAGLEAALETTVAGEQQLYTLTSTGGLAAPSARARTSGGVLAMEIAVSATTTDTTRCSGVCAGLFALGGSGANGEVVAGTYFLQGFSPTLKGAVVFTQTALEGAPMEAPFGTGLEYRGIGLGGNLIGFGAGTVSLDTAGKLQVIDGWERGDAQAMESGGLAGMIGWTRWAGGTIERSDGRSTQEIGANNGRHLVWYRPLSNLPTSGSATYSLIGATAPSRATVLPSVPSEVPGALTSGALAVNFATMRIGIDLAVSFAGNAYTLGSSGGTATPSATLESNGRFSLNSFGLGDQIVMTGNGCTGPNCQGSLDGSLAGDGASHAALTYTFSPGPNAAPQVQGVAAFSRP